MSSHAAQIPSLFCGTFKDVDRRTRSLLRKVVDAGSWQPLLDNTSWLEIDQTPGFIDVWGPSPWVVEGEHVQLFPLMFHLVPLLQKDPDSYLDRLKHLIEDQLHQLWFCLALLPGMPPMPKSERVIRLKALRAMHAFWPTLCAIESRITISLSMCAARMFKDLDWPLAELERTNKAQSIGQLIGDRLALESPDHIATGNAS